QRGGRLEAHYATSLLRVGHTALHVVLERGVVDMTEGDVGPFDLAPDQLCEVEYGRRFYRREVEVLVERVWALHCRDDPSGQVSAVCVMAHLRTVAEDVERILPLHDLLHQVGDDMAHCEADVATHDLDVGERASLAHTDAVEG